MSNVQRITSTEQSVVNKKSIPSYLENMEERKRITAQYMKDNNLQLQHIKSDENPHGGLTIAYQHAQEKQSFIVVATAMCSDKDAFNCTTGRVLAIENFMAGKTINLPYKKKLDGALNPYIQAIFAPLIDRYNYIGFDI